MLNAISPLCVSVAPLQLLERFCSCLHARCSHVLSGQVLKGVDLNDMSLYLC